MDARERDGLKEKRLNLCLMEKEGEDGERKRWRALEDKKEEEEEEEGKRVSEVNTAIYLPDSSSS